MPKAVPVGVRELKANLSHYLRKVQKGEAIPVASHGKVVAKLSPQPAKERPAPEELVTRGFASWNGRLPQVQMPTIKSRGGLVSEVLLEDRE